MNKYGRRNENRSLTRPYLNKTSLQLAKKLTFFSFKSSFYRLEWAKWCTNEYSVLLEDEKRKNFRILSHFSVNLTKRALKSSIWEHKMNKYGRRNETRSLTRPYLNKTSLQLAKKFTFFSFKSSFHRLEWAKWCTNEYSVLLEDEKRKNFRILSYFSVNLTKRALKSSIWEHKMNKYGRRNETRSLTRPYLNKTSLQLAKKLTFFSFKSSFYRLEWAKWCTNEYSVLLEDEKRKNFRILSYFSVNLTKRALKSSIWEHKMNKYGRRNETRSLTRPYLNKTSLQLAKKLTFFSFKSSFHRLEWAKWCTNEYSVLLEDEKRKNFRTVLSYFSVNLTKRALKSSIWEHKMNKYGRRNETRSLTRPYLNKTSTSAC